MPFQELMSGDNETKYIMVQTEQNTDHHKIEANGFLMIYEN